MSKKKLCGVCVAALVASACNDEVNAGIRRLDERPAFAVQRSDFESVAIALLAEDGTLLEESYISSGTNLPGLSGALVGDAFLPTSPCEEGLLTLGGRLRGDYILQVDLESSEVKHQVRTQGEPKGAVFSSNPQDVLCLPNERALVTRLGLNVGASRDALDRGDDIAVLDLAGDKVEARIDLRAFEGKLEAQGDAPAETTQASPGSIVRVGPKHALVGLSRLSAAFQSHPEGAVLLVDTETLSAKKVVLEGLANCGMLFAVPGNTSAAIVQCAGAPYGAAENAGLAHVSVEEGEARLGAVFRGQVEGVSLIGNPTPLNDSKVLVATADFVGETPDVAYLVDLASGAFERVFEAGAPGDLGSGAVHPKTGLVFVPDLTVGVRVLRFDGTRLEEKSSIPLSRELPARYIRPLRAL